MPLVYNLNVSKVQKYALYGVFSVAGIACASSIGRLAVVVQTFPELDRTGNFPCASLSETMSTYHAD